MKLAKVGLFAPNLKFFLTIFQKAAGAAAFVGTSEGPET